MGWYIIIYFIVVHAFLPAAVKNKIVFINDMKELLYYFDASVLPVEYGGKCKCEGGCIPVYTHLSPRE